MSTYLRKCIDIAPTAVVDARTRPAPTTTAACGSSPGGPRCGPRRAGCGCGRTGRRCSASATSRPAPASRREVARGARRADRGRATPTGMQIILLPYRYPRWANETEGIVADGVPRTTCSSRGTATRGSRSTSSSGPGPAASQTWKAFEYRMPPDGHRPGQPVGAATSSGCGSATRDRLAAFEVVNEPNGQLWPQRTPGRHRRLRRALGHRRARRWSSAPAVGRDDHHRRRDRPALPGRPAAARAVDVGHAAERPSCATRRSRTRTDHVAFFDPFVESLLAGARPARLRRGRPLDLVVPQLHRHRARRYRYVDRPAPDPDRSAAGAGRQLDGGPELWATEGGCRLGGDEHPLRRAPAATLPDPSGWTTRPGC